MTGDKGLARVIQGLEAGGCKNLKELNLSQCYMRPLAGAALAHALTSGSLLHLQKLLLNDNDFGIGDEMMVEVIVGLRGCRDHRELNLIESGMGSATAMVVYDAIRDNVWPKLRSLGLDYPDDDCLHHLANVLLQVKGAARWLSRFTFHRGVGRVGCEGPSFWAHALRQGACPALTCICISGKGVSWEYQRQMYDAVEARRHRGPLSASISSSSGSTTT